MSGPATPEEFARVRQEVQDVIECYCDAHALDMHDPKDVYEHRHRIWKALVDSGKLYPTMTYEAFLSAISVEMMRDQVRGGFYEMFGRDAQKPPTRHVAAEVKDFEDAES